MLVSAYADVQYAVTVQIKRKLPQTNESTGGLAKCQLKPLLFTVQTTLKEFGAITCGPSVLPAFMHRCSSQADNHAGDTQLPK